MLVVLRQIERESGIKHGIIDEMEKRVGGEVGQVGEVEGTESGHNGR